MKLHKRAVSTPYNYSQHNYQYNMSPPPTHSNSSLELLEGIKAQINKRNSLNSSLTSIPNPLLSGSTSMHPLSHSAELLKPQQSTTPNSHSHLSNSSTGNSPYTSPPPSPPKTEHHKRKSILLSLPQLGSGSNSNNSNNSSDSKSKSKSSLSISSSSSSHSSSSSNNSAPTLTVKSDDLNNARKNLRKSVIVTKKALVVKPSNEDVGISMEAPEKRGNLYILKSDVAYAPLASNPELWNQRYCLLREGCLYIYTSYTDDKEIEILSLDKGIVREKDVKDSCFQLIAKLKIPKVKKQPIPPPLLSKSSTPNTSMDRLPIPNITTSPSSSPNTTTTTTVITSNLNSMSLNSSNGMSRPTSPIGSADASITISSTAVESSKVSETKVSSSKENRKSTIQSAQSLAMDVYLQYELAGRNGSSNNNNKLNKNDDVEDEVQEKLDRNRDSTSSFNKYIV
ncbi:pleckstrin domain-containing protein [Heterostelium album PN500]|uniref:Pleckstrin domain-containing protein n=1 Tax=Heterostelium pallidum (strain ATCC 26659 / Pp 5 / PN500) TaxID=670386 RepID=D3AX51_HETP5|nr:pleckstrin domain-containing protein [Heterostelium album PN500]EFA86120.1 pleckstrin domain-containing protein [Heterostelium album PN500]|eukprot:XP_020438225.1 pleckstrin domain-containing protein [Heterostelium album PN500]